MRLECLIYWETARKLLLHFAYVKRLRWALAVTCHRLGFMGRFCIAKEETPPCIKPLKIYPRQSWTWTRGNEEGNSCACLKLYQALTRELPPPLALVCTTVMRKWAAVQLHHFTPSAWSSSYSFQHFSTEIHTCCTAHTDSEYREWQRPKKINCRIIQALTGRYLHKTVLVSCMNTFTSELRVSRFAMTPIYFL